MKSFNIHHFYYDRRPVFDRLVLLVLLAAMWMTFTQANAAERNIVLFVTDDQSPLLGCYGDTTARTPAIDALANDGLLFRNAFATTASCSPSRSVILSGVHHHKNGQYGLQHDYHKFESFDDVACLTLPRVLAQSGYRTAQVGKFHVAPEFAFHFEDYLPGNQRNAVEMAENCRQFITAQDDRPFFLYFATADPHRSGQLDESSNLKLKPDLFGNLPNENSHRGVSEEFFNADEVPVPKFLTDNAETRAELAHYYQSCSRVDDGLAKLIEILKQAGVYDKTLIVFTSDHGMPFPGAKTTLYDAGLRVPFVVRNPYVAERGAQCQALISHLDITPSLLDFAGGLDAETNAPKNLIDPRQLLKQNNLDTRDNHGWGRHFNKYHGKSWLHLLNNPGATHWDMLMASHTMHEIQMYYPMRAVRDGRYKLIWNIAHPLPFPFASDLWAAAAWQSQYQQGSQTKYGQKTIAQYIQRPEFELYDIQLDPDETRNLALEPDNVVVLDNYKELLKAAQKETEDPWIMKWEYE
jgi:N-sulfoglucosamine sulfohydrolase